MTSSLEKSCTDEVSDNALIDAWHPFSIFVKVLLELTALQISFP